MMQRCLCACAAILICASAAPAADRGFYVGAGLGFPSFDAEEFGADPTGAEIESDSFGFSLFGGYRFFRFLAVEGGLRDYGRITREQRAQSPSASFRKLDVDIDSWDVSVVGLVPLSPKVDLFAKVGAASWNVDAVQTDHGTTIDFSRDGTDLTYAVGIDFLFNKLGARIEGSWLEIPDSSGAFMLVGSVTYDF